MRYFLLSLPRLISFLLLIMMLPASHADSLELLLMPGPVIEAHQEYEQDCKLCHDTSDKRKQGQLCLDCHDHNNILKDVRTKKGFHGRLPASIRTNCKHCHTEHEGRNAEVVLLNPSTFNHDNTDFHLEGKHRKTNCNACHKPNKKYADAPVNCYGCHKNSDMHDGKHGEKCGDCHSPATWKQSAFDHDNKTDFPLKGAHKETTCSSCHTSQRYKKTPKTCVGCHKIHDIHQGGYGDKCDTCHVSERWDEISFDHNKKTDFPLHGRHKKASCISCHTPDKQRKNRHKKLKLPTDCYSCHKHDDNHKGKHGRECKTCHSPKSWQKHKFDHGKTDFPLRGKHKKLACAYCHKGKVEKDQMKTDCVACHRKDDVHQGKQGQRCIDCHNETGWRNKVFFDHDLSHFPLIGMHAAVQCEECHLNSVYSSTENECNACHAPDDVHKTRLGTDCETCHNPNAWENWLFDHDKDTDFKIDGAHKKAGCYDCHRSRSKGKLKASSDCIYCHRSQDVHNRQFGRQCGQCHSTESFKDVNINQ
jgi:hypothetical protein